jgi:hypothetical protein
MVEVLDEILKVSPVSLASLRQNSGLKLTDDAEFTKEWEHDLPILSPNEQQHLDTLRLGYLNHADHLNSLPHLVEMAIVGPLLSLLGCFSQPFRIKNEKTFQVATPSQVGEIARKLHIWRLKETIWLMIVQSQGWEFSIEAGLNQLISHLMFSPHTEKPLYGLVMTGGEFIFVKLQRNNDQVRYATSDVYVMRKQNNGDLYHVFRILKSWVNA